MHQQLAVIVFIYSNYFPEYRVAQKKMTLKI